MLTPDNGKRAWMREAVCAQIDPELWFPKHKRDPNIEDAKAVCMACPVRRQCAEYADELDIDYGIWGGVLRGVKPRRNARPDCGTESGAKSHRRNGEQVCEACRVGANLAKKQRAERRKLALQEAAQ